MPSDKQPRTYNCRRDKRIDLIFVCIEKLSLNVEPETDIIETVDVSSALHAGF